MVFICTFCKYKTDDKSNYARHLGTIRHKQKVKEGKKIEKHQKSNEKSPKLTQKKQFFCSLCESGFTKKGNLDRHLLKIHEKSSDLENDFLRNEKSKTSKNKSSKNTQFTQNYAENADLKCNGCYKRFSRKYDRQRHEKTCKKCLILADLGGVGGVGGVGGDEKSVSPEITMILRENNFLRNQLEKNNEILKQVVTIAENSSEANKSSSRANEYAISAFNYIARHFNNAEPVKKVDFDSMETIVCKEKVRENEEIIDILIYHHRNKTLVKYIGDAIVSFYRKENPEEQSIWSSDVTRLSYIIRLLVNDNPEWLKDNGGKHISELIITPLLDYLKCLINNFLCHVSLERDDGFMDRYEKMKNAQMITRDIIDKQTLDKDILTYITPYFQFKCKEQLLELK